MSKEALYYIFNVKLPKLDDKVVLDIGSRLGSVLYGVSRKNLFFILNIKSIYF